MEKQIAVQPADGVDFLTDSQGNKKAVVIDLSRHGDLLQDFFDVIIARQRLMENDTISLEDFRRELTNEGVLDEGV